MSVLFNQGEWYEVRGRYASSISDRIASLTRDILFSTPIEDLCEQMKQQYELSPPLVNEEQITVGESEVEIWAPFGSNQRIKTTKMILTIKIPFEGHKDAFIVKPSKFPEISLDGDVVGNQVIIPVSSVNIEDTKVKEEINNKLDTFRKYYKAILEDMEFYNSFIKDYSRDLIESRKERIMGEIDTTPE